MRMPICIIRVIRSYKSLSLAHRHFLVDVTAMLEEDFPDVGLDEAPAVAAQLSETRRNGETSNFQTAGLNEGCHPQHRGIKQDGQDKPPLPQREQQQQGAAEGKHGGQAMHGLEAVRVKQFEGDARHTEDVGLACKLREAGAALVINKGGTYQADVEACLTHTRTHVDVLAEHFAEAANLLIHIPGIAHIERARHKFLHLHLAATDSTRGQERRHREGDGLLHIGKVGAGRVRTAEARHIFPSQFVTQRPEIVRRDDAVAVKEDKILARGMLQTVVAGDGAALVGFIEVAQVQLTGIAQRDVLAALGRAVLHQNDLKILVGLSGEAAEQVLHLVTPVIHRHYH